MELPRDLYPEGLKAQCLIITCQSALALNETKYFQK